MSAELGVKKENKEKLFKLITERFSEETHAINGINFEIVESLDRLMGVEPDEIEKEPDSSTLVKDDDCYLNKLDHCLNTLNSITHRLRSISKRINRLS